MGKKNLKIVYPVFISWICILVWSCQSDNDYIDATEITLVQPADFPEIQYTIENNPITQKGFELGRKLFFDPRISADGSISCNNCHQQSRAFADTPLHPLSIGIDDQTGVRNAPPIFNLAFRKEFFWDGGVTHLDFVAINAIESEIEMGETLENVVAKLNRNEEYRTLFKEAFDEDSITSPRMLQAFSQFLVIIVSDQSRYDQYRRGENENALTDEEKEGLVLFESKCASCHSGALFTDQSFRNNGLSEDFDDIGRALITEANKDKGKFMVPSLRNIEVTAPYMHNAKFNSLEEVLQHYATGVKNSETLDPLLNQNGSLGIDLSAEDQIKIIAFLKTLTDESFLSNPEFKNVR